MRKFLVTLLVAGVLAPALQAGGRKAGSVLIYPVQGSNRPAALLTLISVTNTNTNPLSGSTNVHYEYANAIPDPLNVFCPLACVIFDRVEFLTPADTLTTLATCHNATGAGGEGYLVVSAENHTAFDSPWSHNYLVGSQLSLLGNGGVFSINALPFNAIAATGAATDADGDGQLDFDDVEYEAVPDTLIMDSFLAIANSSLALVNLTGGPHARNTILFQVWNDAEFQLSTTLVYKCWFSQPLITISPLFSPQFLALNTPNDPRELDINCDGIGDTDTGWAKIDSIIVQNAGGDLIDLDGAMVGAIVSSAATVIDGGRLLWESTATQSNGQFVDFGQ